MPGIGKINGAFVEQHTRARRQRRRKLFHGVSVSAHTENIRLCMLEMYILISKP